MGVPKQINIFISLFFFDPLLTGAHSFDQLKRLPARHQVQVVVQLIFRHSGIFKSPRKSFTETSSLNLFSPSLLFWKLLDQILTDPQIRNIELHLEEKLAKSQKSLDSNKSNRTETNTSDQLRKVDSK